MRFDVTRLIAASSTGVTPKKISKEALIIDRYIFHDAQTNRHSFIML